MGICHSPDERGLTLQCGCFRQTGGFGARRRAKNARNLSNNSALAQQRRAAAKREVNSPPIDRRPRRSVTVHPLRGAAHRPSIRRRNVAVYVRPLLIFSFAFLPALINEVCVRAWWSASSQFRRNVAQRSVNGPRSAPGRLAKRRET